MGELIDSHFTEDVSRLLKDASGSLLRRIKKSEDINLIFLNAYDKISDFLSISPKINEILRKKIPNEKMFCKFVDLVVDNVHEMGVQLNIEEKQKVTRITEFLFPLVAKLERAGIPILISKENGQVYPAMGLPVVNYHSIKAKGLGFRDVTSLKKKTQFLNKCVRWGFLPDLIEIEDDTTSRDKMGNILLWLLSSTSSHKPTFNQLTHKGYDKKLLVSIPDSLNITSFSKEYKKQLSLIHEDFMGKRIRGDRKVKRSMRFLF